MVKQRSKPSTLLQEQPAGPAARLPPLAVVHGSAAAPDGSAGSQQQPGLEPGTAAAAWQGGAGDAAKLPLHQQQDEAEQRQQQQQAVEPSVRWTLPPPLAGGQQDHLLLRAPSRAAHEQQPQQQLAGDAAGTSSSNDSAGEMLRPARRSSGTAWSPGPAPSSQFGSRKPSADEVAAPAPRRPRWLRHCWPAGPRPGWRLRLLRLLDAPGTSWGLMVMTLFVIFQEDFKYAALPPAADLGCEAVTATLLLAFLAELALSCLVRPGFFASFYCLLDAVAVASLAFELPALRAVLLLGATQEYVDLNTSQSYLLAAGAQALVSSKAGRAAKMVRLLRQLQLIRLFKQLEVRSRLKRAFAADGCSGAAPAGSAAGPAGADGLAAAEAAVLARYSVSESRVGQRLSDLTMQRVICGILAMLVVLPALEVSSGINGGATPLALGGLAMLHSQALTGCSGCNAFNNSLAAFQRSLHYELAGQQTGQLLLLVVANTTYASSDLAASVPFNQSSGSDNDRAAAQEGRARRYLELQAASHSSWVCPDSSAVTLAVANASAEPLPPAAGVGPGLVVLEVGAAARLVGVDGAALVSGGCSYWRSFVLVDVKWALQAQSVYGMARTLFLVCLLGLGAMLIHADTYRLVLRPVQRMVERVREMAEDPLTLAAVRLSAAVQPHPPPHDGAREAVHAAGGADCIACVTLQGGAPGKDDDGGAGALGGGWWWRRHSSGAASASSGGRTSRSSGGRLSLWPLTAARVQPAAGDEDSGAAVLAAAPRVSGAALAARARRLSAGMAAGLSTAGRVSGRLREQLQARVAAVRAQLSSGGGGADGVGGAAGGGQGQGAYETQLLEAAIYKICALLAVGFGDAGAEVIAANIRKEGDLRPIVPGKKAVAVFGFCDIRQFTDTTEVLQEGVMEFVNTIAHLVHGSVAAHGGAANKNIGDAFLLVWKLPKGMDGRDISALSSSGGVGCGTHEPSSSSSSGGGTTAGTSRLRTATLQWPRLSEGEEEEQQLPGGAASSSSASPRGAASSSAAAASPCCGSALGGGLRAGSITAGAEELSRTLSSALQQQLTIKRAASELFEPGGPPGGSRAGSRLQHAASSLAGGSGDGSGSGPLLLDGAACRSSSFSGGLGLRRAVMSLKSVAALPLSTAARSTIINTIADNALASFVVVQVAIVVSRPLRAYSARPDLNARMPGFRVQMGFGLHVGWAIEGAIGSEFKIDASYLSPNVNLASRLEAATKQYRVPLLLSRDFVDCLSPAVAAKVRQVDCVMVKGSKQPLALFAYDLDLPAAAGALRRLADAHREAEADGEVQQQQQQQQQAAAPGGAAQGGASGAGLALLPGVRSASLAALPDAASAARSSVVVSGGARRGDDDTSGGPDEAELLLSLDYEDDWSDNPVVAGSWGLTPAFKEAWDEGLALYLAGDWPAARAVLSRCLHGRVSAATGLPVEDGPAATLLEVMGAHGFVAPPSWAGVRELTEK